MISILLPVFNAAPYLDECLQSILEQTEKHWELIAVEDHSSDHSFEILKAYAEKDKRIKVFKNPAKGIIPALRKAYKESEGQFISRMDADDKMLPEKLSLLKHTLLKAGKGHVTTGKVRYFSEQTLGDGYRKYESWLNELTKASRNFNEIYKECVIPSPVWMVFREDLNKCGAFQSDIYPEDYDLCFRFYKAGLKVLGIDSYLHLWRDHPARSSRNDPHYANSAYLNLKIPYFLELEQDQSRPLVLWGAGKKGKAIAKLLLQQEISFQWVCNQKTKWGRDIYTIKMESFSILADINQAQLIIAVAGPDDQAEISNYLKQLGWQPNTHYFFFC